MSKEPMCSSATSPDSEMCKHCEFKNLCWET
jgi:hypothetical protein